MEKKITHTDTEIEARFLEIDVPSLRAALNALGAEDKGEDLITDIIFYDKALAWSALGKTVRLRSNKQGTTLNFKHYEKNTIDGTREIECTVGSLEQAKKILEAIGLVAYRVQEKKRHTFLYHGVSIDIDTWPLIPTYVELEGPSERAVKEVAAQLKLPWENAVFKNAKIIIEEHYHIPVSTLTYFTFDRTE